jgi:hypothetical protein
MVNTQFSNPPSIPFDASDHTSVRALLAEYALARTLGQALHPAWQALETHLARCASCRGEADELLGIVERTYNGALQPPPAAPTPNLAFLSRRFDAAALSGQMWQVVIQFSQALLPQMRVAMVARQAGSHLRYSYRVEPAHAAEPELTVEVFEHDDRPGLGFLQVTVEFPDADPFDVPACRLILGRGDARHEAGTNQHGVAIIRDLPLDDVEDWRIAVQPQEGV